MEANHKQERKYSFFTQIYPILRFVAIPSTATQDKIEIEIFWFFIYAMICWLIVKLPVVAMNPANKVVE